MLNPFKKLLKGMQSISVANLERFETRLLTRYAVPAFSPVFIIGPPRSGTTLIYQALVCRYRLAYFCNLANRFATSPALATQLIAKSLGLNPPLSFESNYGESRDLRGLNQGNRIWSRWFPGPQRFFTSDELPDEADLEMQQTIACIEAIGQAPFVNKSIGHSVRIQSLVRAFPTAVFLRIRRNPQHIVESILNSRREYFGDETRWFSVQPSNFARIEKLPAIPQICEQVLGIERDIERELGLCSQRRVFEVDYIDFCQDPTAIFRSFADRYHNVTSAFLQDRYSIPPSFRISTRTRVDDEEQQAIAAELHRLASSQKAPS